MLRIAIMSDIHFGKNAAYRDFAVSDDFLEIDAEKAVSMKDSLIDILMNNKPDYLFIPGDLTSQALPSEFSYLDNTIREIIARSECRPIILYTAGNHDTQWGISGISNNKDDVDDLLDIASLPFLRNFNHKIEFSQTSELPFSGVYEDENVQVLVINTGYYSKSNEEYHHGKVGIKQMEWIKSICPLNKNKWRIILMHHHPYRLKFPTIKEDISCLEDGDELIELVAKSGVDIIIHGHRHHPILRTKYDNTWENPITFICCGSLSVQSRQRYCGSIPNTFHILEIENKKSVSKIIKAINYEFKAYKGWTESKYQEETPYDGISYYGEIIEKSKLKEIFVNIFNQSRNNRQSDMYYELPVYDLLPKNVKCSSLNDINGIIDDIAKERIIKRTGYYPDNVIIKE